MITTNPSAFDAFANNYDTNFTYSTLGQLLRPRVWEKLAEHFALGQSILELTCGAGEDAVWLAKRGVWVTATDGSAKMVQAARAKAEAAGLSAQVATAQVSLQQIIEGKFACPEDKFDGVFSNFGGLNTIGDWAALAESLAKMVKPGGKVILVPMGPVCPWEIAWHLLHGQAKVAFRRFGQTAPAKIGQAIIPIWYPSAGRLRRDFAPWFEPLQTESLGLWLPPSYLDHFVNRWPDFFAQLNRFEKLMARLTHDWGDHYIIIFQRNLQ